MQETLAYTIQKDYQNKSQRNDTQLTLHYETAHKTWESLC